MVKPMSAKAIDLSQYDTWFDDGIDVPVAIVRREILLPVAGRGSVIFPPTYAGPDDLKFHRDFERYPNIRKEDAVATQRGYSLYATDTASDGTRSVVLDSVGSQANRMESLFRPPSGPYKHLVPQVEITVHRKGFGPMQVNLLDAGHRAADAVIRFSDKGSQITEAFKAIDQQRDYSRMVELSPLSLVMGVWDSRDTRVKVPRMISSTVRGYNVIVMHRNAQYTPAMRKGMEKLEIEEMVGAEKLSEIGLAEAPAYALGGVVCNGDIVRESILNLVVLRNVAAGSDSQKTLSLRRYILGLGLVCLTAPLSPDYRSGCMLVPGGEVLMEVVRRNGKREPFSAEQALEYAEKAAASLGPREAVAMTFDSAKAKAALKSEQKKAKEERAAARNAGKAVTDV